MPSLKQKLRKAFKNAARVAVVGVGSELRADDAAGLLVLEHLQRKLLPQKKVGQRPPAAPSDKPDIKLFNGGTAPENLTGEIKRFKPDLLIMVDAIELGKRPGTIDLLDLQKIKDTAFLTHKLPLKLMLDYLAAEMSFTFIFIGIQPKSLDFAAPVSKPVLRSCRVLVDLLSSSLL